MHIYIYIKTAENIYKNYIDIFKKNMIKNKKKLTKWTKLKLTKMKIKTENIKI